MIRHRKQVIDWYLDCGDLHNGFALRVISGEFSFEFAFAEELATLTLSEGKFLTCDPSTTTLTAPASNTDVVGKQ